MIREKKIAYIPDPNNLNEDCEDKFICDNRNKGQSELTFNEFRWYIANKFEKQLKEITNLYEQITNYQIEPTSVTRLYHDVWINFMYELDGSDLSVDIESNLKENYMHDYLLDMKNTMLD